MNRILDSGCIRARSLLGIHSLSARLRHSSQSTHPQHGSNGKESKSESRHRHWSDAKIYASSSLDPYFNLAFEDWCVTFCKLKSHVQLLTTFNLIVLQVIQILTCFHRCFIILSEQPQRHHWTKPSTSHSYQMSTSIFI